MPSLRRLSLLLLLLCAWGLGTVQPAWQALQGDARDYASFHYAVAEWRDGGDPYEAAALTARARAEGERKKPVYPFLYPPPALLLLSWTSLVGLSTGYRTMFWLHQAALLASGLVVRRWLGLPWWWLALLAATFGPLIHSARLGQVNTVVLLAVVGALWLLDRGRDRAEAASPASLGLGSVTLATAILLKLSPLVLVARWLPSRQWAPLLATLGATLGLAALSLPLVGLAPWQRFLGTVLPELGSGSWGGLDVPLQLTQNHSLPNLIDQVWPSTDGLTLSPTARLVSRAASLALLAPLLLLGRQRRDALGEASLMGALLVVVVLSPPYAWDHHLVLLLLPLATVGAALTGGRLPRWTALPALLSWACLSQSMSTVHELMAALPALAWPIREAKTAAALGLGLLSAWAAWRSPLTPAPAPPP